MGRHENAIIGPVGISITVGVSFCCLGLTLMWCVVVTGRGALWEHAKHWPSLHVYCSRCVLWCLELVVYNLC